MDIIELYNDFGIEYKTEGHKHCRPGWVNTECPFCAGNPGYHLGYELSSDHYYCWRCGWHAIVPTIAQLIHLKETEVCILIKRYGLLVPKITETVLPVPKLEHRLPSSTGPLSKSHKQYLKSRGFNPEELERMWNLVGTSNLSLLDGINYKQRIIIPVIWDEAEISFISRDITGKHPLKYIVCPKARELILHKHVVYGKQEEWLDTGICVEGCTDVWRFGTVAFGTFGIEYTPQQVRVISKYFKRVFIIFDPDPQALIQARKLAADLKFRRVITEVITGLECDPGDMTQLQVTQLIKQLI